MHLNIFAQCSPSPQFKGLWRDPDDRTGTGYRSIEHWISIGRQLEDACIDALFFADVHGLYDVYQNSWRSAVRYAVQVPTIDPALVVPAVAANTTNLGFAITYSTSYHQPYECARLFTSLDHLTGGRIGWNIVTSYLRSAESNGLGAHLDHDLRYERADEYVQVVRALWEQSWSDGAVVRDVDNDVFTDPDAVREIDHHGKWFTVRGPHQCEPSPQRTPVLYQAGASPRGIEFAARHAEVVFLSLPDPLTAAPKVGRLRAAAASQGRDPADIKALQGTMVMLGETKEEAKAKADLFVRLCSAEGQLAKWCGWTGIDLAAYPDDTPVSDIGGQASRSVMSFFEELGPGREWTVADIKFVLGRPRRPRKDRPVTLFGTPEDVADRMEEWLEVANVDGFNLMPCPPSTGLTDICRLLVPELQRRKIFRRAYDKSESTLRERYFGAGRSGYTGLPLSSIGS
ncbi:LLM class flavin-dependent oxidoreductase [Nocardia sp. NPDC051321]|uniref:LLM class flavin-dependent oxidoreductase n=1 Tax=Nocardia sp. NPDC051321 TaxID=3364323 RepID=UPI0037AA6DC8